MTRLLSFDKTTMDDLSHLSRCIYILHMPVNYLSTLANIVEGERRSFHIIQNKMGMTFWLFGVKDFGILVDFGVGCQVQTNTH